MHEQTFLPTDQLTRDAGLAALVDEVAASGFESSHVGPAGAPSEAYARFAKLAKAAPRDVLLALLRHRSAVVRAYVAEHIARALPEHARALADVIAETTALHHRSGCMFIPTTLSRVVLDNVAQNLAHPEVQALLLEVSGDPAAGGLAATALSLVAPRRPRETVERARAWLAKGLDEETHRRVLAALVTSGSDAALELIEPATRHAAPRVRQAAAGALGAFGSPVALALAEALLSDPDPRVVEGAALAYLGNPGRSPDRARALAAEGDRASAMIRGGRPTPEALEAFERQVLANPTNAGPVSALLSLRPVCGEITECVRRIAAKLEPERSGGVTTARTEAIVYLHQIASPRDLPEMRRSLATMGSREHEYALKSIVEQRDLEAIPPLVAKLADANDYGKLAYAGALLSLGARGSAGAIEAAAATAEAPVAARLREVAAQLGGPATEAPSFGARVARLFARLRKPRA